MFSRYTSSALFHVTPQAYRRAFRVGDSLVLAQITTPDQLSGQLQIDVLQQTAPYSTDALRLAVGTVLGIPHDLTEFYAKAQQIPSLWEWLAPLAGMPIFCSENLYEALLFTIIEQHIAWASATKIQRRLVELFGDFIEYDGIRYYALPTPTKLASLTIDDLAPLKLTTTRLKLLIEIARMTVNHELEWATLLHFPPELLYEQLLQIKGVGHWTASVAVSRATGLFPYIHYNDVALQAAVNTYFFGLPKRATIATTQDVFAQYGKWAGLVANFLMIRWILDKYASPF